MAKNNKKRTPTSKRMSILITVWCTVFFLMSTTFLLTHSAGFDFKQTSYYLINIIVSFSSFVATSFFGISIFYHNASIREQNAVIRNQTTAVNKRAEAFRNLQFIASNYTIIDFVENMTIYEEYQSYVDNLLKTKSFMFYLLERGISSADVLEKPENYRFLTVRLPISFIEGKKTISKLKILSFKFDKAGKIHRFVPPSKDEPSKALILYNEIEQHSEAVLNLVMNKDSDFYTIGEVNPFLKINISMEIESMLGVVVSGAIELYFTNPQKIEESGANKYKINSSQFELFGMPKLVLDREYNPD